MSAPEVKINKAVGKNMVKVSVSRGFGQSEQLNAEMDVPVGQAKQAVDMMFANVITPRAISFAKETVAYQLEMDVLTYSAQEREFLLQNQAEIDKKVKARLKKGQ